MTGDFDFQIMIWGYAVSGAHTVETRISEEQEAFGYPVWDYGRGYLKTILLNDQEPPERFALWWVCEHQRRTDDRYRLERHGEPSRPRT